MKKIITLFMLLFLPVSSFAAHPLITDDTGTQGKGKFQVEVNTEFTSDKEADVGVTAKTMGQEIATIFSYGILENIDITFGLPYLYIKIDDGINMTKNNGISDMSIELKWRFFEKEDLSFSLKPGITFPTGDENKGLGNGKISYDIIFITTKKIDPLAFHLNIGYIYNEYKLQADKDANRNGIWLISLASEVEVIKDIKAVVNIGVEENPDKTSSTPPVTILGGLIYSLSKEIDIDIGVGGGLNKPETDSTFLAGIALRF